MKLVVRDAAALASIRVVDLAAYLRASGWERDSPTDMSTLWALGDYEVVLPANNRFRDYACNCSA